MTDFLQTLDERSDGIGAQDGTLVMSSFRNAFMKQDYATNAPAGRLYRMALMEANWQRKRAFDRIPAYTVLEPAGNHTFGATEAELRLGCPAWPR